MMPPDVHLAPCHVDRDSYESETLSIEDICHMADVPYRYSGGTLPRVGLTHGGGHRRSLAPNGEKVLVVDLDLLPKTSTEPEQAVRILEVLAHSFHEYAARESARGLFR
jgi:hypothetical protein